jgi:ribosomal protein S18 acetylase RimI-like enzyme
MADTVLDRRSIEQEPALSTPRPRFRPAASEDAAVLAELVNEAGEGMPLYLWGKLAQPGESAWDVGARRAAREQGAFSYRNATMVEHEGRAVGCLIGYEIPDVPKPVDPNMPAMFRPLQELENLAPGTWYVNVLAVLLPYRNLGYGTALLRLADDTGRRLGKRGMSVIVNDSNTVGRRLYERVGYRETARRPMVKEGWANPGRDWVLLTKRL